jgi:hypothetical protein
MQNAVTTLAVAPRGYGAGNVPCTRVCLSFKHQTVSVSVQQRDLAPKDPKLRENSEK